MLVPAQVFFSELPQDANALVAFIDSREVTRAHQKGLFSASAFQEEDLLFVDVCVELCNFKVDWLADARDVAIRENFATWKRLGSVPLVLASKEVSRCFQLPFANVADIPWPQVAESPEQARAEAQQFVEVATELVDAQLLQNFPWTPSPESLQYVSVNALLTKTSSKFVQPGALFQHHSTLADKLI
ncbi:hypothetical protein BG60_09310 [Caballeronia zhejiangensis]|uniref:Uncharacterized protein n=2 Tax=Burkholderiales TaxID=80840 RepID=A0A656QGC4_9BURK|nr:hypothetical protein BG58_28425 [Caballeronia jiangsuensis]KDR28895.1 hypothetical protein BG60_09310 [Caballeronia zhejiangensis]